MDGYEFECGVTFLKHQGKLFSEPVVETVEEAIQFLEDAFAQVFNSPDEIRVYWEENGVDTEGMTDDDIVEALEVFLLPDGRYMVVEA